MAEISVPVVRNFLQANERLAAANRKRFDDAGIFVFNLMSSPSFQGCYKMGAASAMLIIVTGGNPES